MSSLIPTKSNYSKLAENLKLAKEGYTLLEQKREVLVMNLSSLLHSIREKRQELDETLFEVFSALNISKLEMGNFQLNQISKYVKQDYEASILMHSIMGVVVPKLIFTKKEEQIIPMGLSGTTPIFDSLLLRIKEIRGLMADVAYLENTAWKLANEIKKTQRRINALDNFTIPNTAKDMKFIKNILEEKDRETLFQVKRIKANKIKAKKLKSKK